MYRADTDPCCVGPARRQLTADHVVVSVGLEPRTDLAASSGLELDDKHGGYRVNAELEARSNLWVVRTLMRRAETPN